MKPISICSLLLSLFLFSDLAFAKLELPKSLGDGDRRRAVEVLGASTQLRLMGDPYPLGGYSGVDIGVSRDSIPGAQLNELGTPVNNSGDYGLWAITLGKGLFYDIDVFLQFVPFSQQDQVTSFGGGGRWLFYEMTSYPAFFSLQATANSVSFQNLMNFSNQSLDLMASALQGDLTFFAGFGLMRSTGIFMGGPTGVTADGTTQLESVAKGRGLLGASYRWSDYYASVQVDRSTIENYSIKLGYRY